MKALLLAAGKATRLGELSTTTPKCLHRVGDEALLDRVIRQLEEAGVSEFLINTHHLAARIADHVSTLPSRDRITLVHEDYLLGTLGTVRANVDFFAGGSGWVLHADNFMEGSLSPFRSHFLSRPARAWGSMLTFVAAHPSSCGVVLTDAESVVTAFYEKVAEPPSDQASAATFILDHRVFELVGNLPSSATDISHDLVPELVGRMTAFKHYGAVIDIGTREGLRRAQQESAVLPVES